MRAQCHAVFPDALPERQAQAAQNVLSPNTSSQATKIRQHHEERGEALNAESKCEQLKVMAVDQSLDAVAWSLSYFLADVLWE